MVLSILGATLAKDPGCGEFILGAIGDQIHRLIEVLPRDRKLTAINPAPEVQEVSFGCEHGEQSMRLSDLIS